MVREGGTRVEDKTYVQDNSGRTCCVKTGAWLVEIFHALAGLPASTADNQIVIVRGALAVDRLCWSTSVVESHVAVPRSVLLGARRYLWFVSSMGREAVAVCCP